MPENLIKYLSGFVTEQRIELFNRILQNRTRYISVVLEDIYQPHNASAVLRTCDCLGIQDVHIIENKNKFNVEDGVSLGSSKWLTLQKHNQSEFNSVNAINSLKEKGYRIIATTLHTKSMDLDELDLEKGKFALVFGTELTGMTPEAIESADEFLKIPMYGFTESFNISVSAAITLHHLTHKLRNTDFNWHLTDNEMNELRIEWLKKTIKSFDQIIRRYKQNQDDSA